MNPNVEALVKQNGAERILRFEDLGIDSVVRIPASEFKNIRGEKGLFGHFNLESTNRSIGERYLITPILRNGRVGTNTETEQPPLLSISNAYVAECVAVENGLSYNDLTPEYFSHSMVGINTPENLRDRLWERYRKSRNVSLFDVAMSKVGYSLLQIPAEIKNGELRVLISEEAGYTELKTAGVSSNVFERQGKVYKITKRDSLARQKSDYEALKTKLQVYADHIPVSHILSAKYGDEEYTCVIQDKIDGVEINKLSPKKQIEAFRQNKNFLLALTGYFFEAVTAKELYPDIVGWPENQHYSNSINLMRENGTGKIYLCDVGLSCHEDTVKKYNGDYYSSPNAKTYTANMHKMEEFRTLLESL